MMKKMLIVALSILVLACNPSNTNEAENNENNVVATIDTTVLKFWNNLSALQGKSFEGKLLDAPANDDFAGKKLVMHVLSADAEAILIPFNVGDNLSRTWIFKLKNGRIELKHDHRMEDGSDDPVTMYGGTSTNSGTENVQVFPADQQTLDMLPHAFSNIWWVTVDSTTYTYNLRRVGTDRLFTVVFDLTKEVEKPAPSWGWEKFGK